MTLALILTAVVALAAVTALAAVALRSSLCTGPPLVGRTVLVNTIGDTLIRGVVHGQHADRWILRQATVLVVGSDAEAPAGGSLHVPVGRVDYVQEITPGEKD